MKAHAAILLVLSALAASANVAYAGPNGDAIQMSAQNGSDESGTADITQANDGIKVFVHIEQGAPGTVQPVQIARGHCDNVGDAAVFQLTGLVEGESTTILPNVSVNEISGRVYGEPSPGLFAVVVRKTLKDPTIVSCGDIRP
jgi:hypothetical protein